MTIFIKNMVCRRCINVVTAILQRHGLTVADVQLGEARVREEPSAGQVQAIRTDLEREGFAWLDDKSSRLVEQVKSLVIDEIHHGASRRKRRETYSAFLSRETNHDYSHLSKLFSSVEGMTIEKYIIAQKIERAKELLVYDERSLAEIADELDYSSSQHLSTQFKQTLGMTPSEFKRTHTSHRQHLDHVSKGG